MRDGLGIPIGKVRCEHFVAPPAGNMLCHSQLIAASSPPGNPIRGKHLVRSLRKGLRLQPCCASSVIRRSQVVNLPVVFHQYQYIHAFVVCDLAGLLVPAWQGFFFSPDESQGGCQGPEFHIGERELQWRKRGLPSSCVMVWTVECVGVAASEKFAKKHSIGCTVGKTCTIPTMIWL